MVSKETGFDGLRWTIYSVYILYSDANCKWCGNREMRECEDGEGIVRRLAELY